MKNYQAPGITAPPSEDNMRYFNVMILGPTQSPMKEVFLSWSGFYLKTEEHPMAAPKTELSPSKYPKEAIE